MINYLVTAYLVVCGIVTGDALTLVAAGAFAVAGAIACADFRRKKQASVSRLVYKEKYEHGIKSSAGTSPLLR